MQEGVELSRHSVAMRNRFARGDVQLLRDLVSREFSLATARKASAAQQSRRRAQAMERRNERGRIAPRYGRLYVHGDAQVFKMGMALANDCQRAFGLATATYWPNGVGYATREKYLGRCSEKEARALLKASETMALAVFSHFLVVLGREVATHSLHAQAYFACTRERLVCVCVCVCV